MAANKKAKRAIPTAITANTEQPTTIRDHPQPVPVTPERSNRSKVTGKHPRDVTETKQDTHKTCPIVHTTWAAWKAAPTFPIRVIITNLPLGGGKFEKKNVMDVIDTSERQRDSAIHLLGSCSLGKIERISRPNLRYHRITRSTCILKGYSIHSKLRVTFRM